MDHALPDEELDNVRKAIESQLGPNMAFHALRTRLAGSRRFVDFHLLVPGQMSVREGHALSSRIEAALKGLEVTVHIEPIEDKQAWDDSPLLPVEKAEGHNYGNESPSTSEKRQ
jgi:divalent metal cation (Fe/Co/Zn/Cd) transporter